MRVPGLEDELPTRNGHYNKFHIFHIRFPEVDLANLHIRGKGSPSTKPTLRYTTGYDGISWNIMGYTGIMCVCIYIYKYLCMICVHIYIHCV